MLRRHDDKLDHLAEIELFRRCTRRQLREVAQLTTEIDAPSGAVLCREGETGRECFVVRWGHASVSIGGDQVATIGPGDLFGELALLDGQPRVATVTTTSDMRLVLLSRPDFDRLLQTMPDVSRRILQTVGARLRAADTLLHTHRLNA
jgi:CRP-like cAMP-binding protein